MGCAPVATSNWYSWFAHEMSQRSGVTVVLRDFPDPYQCKESVWAPFVTNDIGLDEDTVIVGHSTGAACAMRLLESEPKRAAMVSTSPSSTSVRGVVLVAAAYTDMGDKSERRSEYFNRPWNWEKMKQGANKIALFHGTDDPLIPVAEARFIAEKLKGDNFDYYEMMGASHFFQPWNEILEVVDDMIKD